MTAISKLGFNILLVFAFIDGSYVPEEGRQIARYIRDRIRKESDPDLDRVSIYLDITVAYASGIDYLKQFNELASEEDKVELVKSAYEVIGADNIIDKEERGLFEAMGQVFHMDLQPMLLPSNQFLN